MSKVAGIRKPQRDRVPCWRHQSSESTVLSATVYESADVFFWGGEGMEYILYILKVSPHKPTISQYRKCKDEQLSFILHQCSLVDLFPVFLYPGLPCLKFKMACAFEYSKLVIWNKNIAEESLHSSDKFCVSSLSSKIRMIVPPLAALPLCQLIRERKLHFYFSQQRKIAKIWEPVGT